jgi:CubicO group peptidase (beta-lactamase class C family)
MRRFITLYCSSVEFDDYSENTPIKFNQLKDYGISESQWGLYERSESRFAFGAMKMLPVHDPDAAVFLAGLSEIDSVAIVTDTPRLRDRQWWITFKHTIYGKERTPLQLPRKENETSLLLDESPASTSPFNQTNLEQIRSVCRDWAGETGVPHVALVVYKGRVVFHEAFNAKASSHLVNVESPLWMASITKLLTGVLMMQFVDQGLVELDAPIEKYLPELSSAVESKLTVRHLFTHTTGLDDWAGEWASDWNPALENQVAQVLPFTKVGEKFSYHRVGYAIAGKMMERITGRAVPYLFQDYLFTPLGLKSAYADNTYGGLYCTAIDLAHLGQMLLNRGRYNGCKFFSEDSYHQMLPAKLAGIDRQWGIGTSLMEGHGLSKEAFGHLAASGAVFRVDPKNDLIIVSARNKVSRNQEEFEKRLIEACTAPFRRE